jgi:outer membrane protein TolC
MKHIIRSLVIAGAMGLPQVAAAQPVERLTLDTAVAMAMANNRTVAMANRESGKAAHDVATARSRRLPQFGVEATVSELLRPVSVHFPQGAFGTYPTIGPIPATDTSVTTAAKPAVLVSAQLTQPLTQLYEITLNVRVT